MADASLAIPKVIKYEGIYDNDPDDTGGETVYGITRKYQPNWKGWAKVDQIKSTGIGPLVSLIQHDLEIQKYVAEYYETLWNTYKLDEVKSQALAETIYNGAINQGAGRTITWLQYCINALKQDGDDIGEDGLMGAGTVEAVNGLIDSGKGDLLNTLLSYRRGFAYIETAHQRKTNRKFIKGWISRLSQGG